MIRHIVAVRFKTDTAAAAKAEIFQRLERLQDHLSGIHDFQHRVNISPEEPVVHGFRDLFWIDFEDATARDAYLVDPAHKAAGAALVAMTDGGPDGILVLDFDV